MEMRQEGRFQYRHGPAARGAGADRTGRAADRQAALDFGAKELVDLEHDALEDVGTVVGPVEIPPLDGLAIDFVVEAERAQLNEIAQRVRDERLLTNIGRVSALDDAVAAFNEPGRRNGKTVVRIASQSTSPKRSRT